MNIETILKESCCEFDLHINYGNCRLDDIESSILNFMYSYELQYDPENNNFLSNAPITEEYDEIYCYGETLEKNIYKLGEVYSVDGFENGYIVITFYIDEIDKEVLDSLDVLIISIGKLSDVNWICKVIDIDEMVKNHNKLFIKGVLLKISNGVGWIEFK